MKKMKQTPVNKIGLSTIEFIGLLVLMFLIGAGAGTITGWLLADHKPFTIPEKARIESEAQKIEEATREKIENMDPSAVGDTYLKPETMESIGRIIDEAIQSAVNPDRGSAKSDYQ